MSTLWSGRFDSAPDAAVFDFCVVPLRSPALRRRRHRQPGVGAKRSPTPACCRQADAARDPRRARRTSSRRAGPTRPGSSGPTKTSTRSSSASSSSASATPAAACTPGARATSRCRSTCACSCGAASRCCRRAIRRADRRARATLAERCGDARMPAYTHLRRAQPVLVAHFLLAHAAALRRDHARLRRGGRGGRRAAARVGRGRRAPTTRSTPRARRATRASRASSPTASTRRRIAISCRRSCTRARSTMVHLSRFAEDMIIFSGEEHGFFELSDARRPAAA